MNKDLKNYIENSIRIDLNIFRHLIIYYWIDLTLLM